ncbi:MAG TPA: DUF1579 family protein [Gemmatimonadales bacterium]|nr:DUF1579 family protein [Gemmatimonadales bacterium]
MGPRSVAAGTLALVSAAASGLAAQGGQRVARSAQVSVAQSAEAKLAPARGMLRTLAGTWHFEMRFAGNFDDAADVSGTRVFKQLFDSLRLEWTEVLDHSPVQGRGVVGFDEKSGRFFSSGVYSSGSTPEFLMGMMDDGEPLVTFTPLPFMPDVGRAPGQAFALSVIDADHFTVVALDRAWRAVFTRQQQH